MYLRQHFKMDAASIACCALAFLLYYNSLDAGFVYDDSRAILNNPDILPSSPLYSLWLNDFWGTALKSTNSHGSYRPICVFSFRLNYWACGFRPWGYHLVNVLLHVLATGLVLRVGRHVLPPTSSTMAGLLFASHPIHTEAVSGIVGRADILSCIFYLLSFLMYINHVRLRDMPFQNDSDLIKKFNNRLSKIDCCDVPFGERKHRFYDAVQDVIEVIKVGSCFNALQDLPGLLASCSVHQWAYLSLAVVLATAAMLSKETGVTVILVCAVYDVLRSKRAKSTKWRLSFSLGILGLSLCVVLLARMYLMGSHTPVFALSDNPTARSPSFLTRAFTFLYLPSANLQLLLYPRWLSYDWSMDAIPRISTVFDPRNAVSLVFYYTIYKSTASSIENMFKKRKKFEKSCYRKLSKHFQSARKSKSCPSCKHSLGDVHSASCKASNNNNNNASKCDCLQPSEVSPSQHQVFLVCIALIALPFLPATNLFFYVGFVIAERVLYLPSVGYCYLVAYGCQLISYRTSRKLVYVCFAILLCVFSVRTLVRNRDWYDEESLYRSGIPINPPKSYGNLGSVLSTQGRMEEAERAFRMALYYRPNMAEVHYNLGILLQRKEQFEDAIQSYQLAIQCRPSLALAHLNLGQLLASRGRCEEAESVLRRCSQLDGTGLKDRRTHENTRITALLHLGRLHADRGKYEQAVLVYKEAVSSMPPGYQPQILYNLLGEALTRLHRHMEAEQWYRSALDAKPDHIPAHLTYGKLLAKNKTRVMEAERLFQRAQNLAPTDPTVYQHFGQFLSEMGRHTEAARQYLIGAQLAPDQYDLVLAAATALRQTGRKYEAEVYYRQAVTLKPEDSGSHSNLGAILHLNGKYREAAESYRHALRLQPHDATTLNNLQKLRNLLNRMGT